MTIPTYKPGDQFHYVETVHVGTNGTATLKTLRVVKVTKLRVYLSDFAPGCDGRPETGYYFQTDKGMHAAYLRFGQTPETAMKRALQVERSTLDDLERKATCRRKTIRSLEQQLAGVHTMPMFEGVQS